MKKVLFYIIYGEFYNKKKEREREKEREKEK